MNAVGSVGVGPGVSHVGSNSHPPAAISGGNAEEVEVEPVVTNPAVIDEVPAEVSPVETEAPEPSVLSSRMAFLNTTDFTAIDTDSNGTLSIEEARTYAESQGIIITDELLVAIANNMTDSTENGEITPEEFQRAIEIITGYAEVMDLSEEEAARAYFSGTSFRLGLNALRDLKAREIIAMGEIDFSSIINADILGIALRERYSEGVITALIDLIPNNSIDFDYRSVTADYLASRLLRVVEHDYPLNQDYTADNIMAWLRNLEVTTDASFDEEIIAELGQELRPSRTRGSDVTEQDIAVSYLEGLIRESRFAKAERALEILSGRVAEYSERFFVEGIEEDERVRSAFGQAYLGRNRLEEAFSYAQGIINAELRNRIFPGLFEAALSNIEDMDSLNFAIGVTGELEPSQQTVSYAKIAARCLESRTEEIRNQAATVLGRITDVNFTFSDNQAAEVLRMFQVQGIEIDENEGVTVRDLIPLVENNLKLPLTILTIRERVLINGELQIEHAQGAITELETIIDDNTDDPQLQAQAYGLIAEILGASLRTWDSNQSIDTNFDETAAAHIIEQMFRAARAEGELYLQLAEDPNNTADTGYYREMAIAANGRISQPIYDWATQIWLDRGDGGRYDSLPSGSSRARGFFQDAGKNLIPDCLVPDPQQQEGQDGPPVSVGTFSEQYLHIGNEALHAVGEAPAYISDQTYNFTNLGSTEERATSEPEEEILEGPSSTQVEEDEVEEEEEDEVEVEAAADDIPAPPI